MVPTSSVVFLVLEFLKEQRFGKTSAALEEEASELLRNLTPPDDPLPLPAILEEFVGFKAKEDARRRMLEQHGKSLLVQNLLQNVFSLLDHIGTANGVEVSYTATAVSGQAQRASKRCRADPPRHTQTDVGRNPAVARSTRSRKAASPRKATTTLQTPTVPAAILPELPRDSQPLGIATEVSLDQWALPFDFWAKTINQSIQQHHVDLTQGQTLPPEALASVAQTLLATTDDPGGGSDAAELPNNAMPLIQDAVVATQKEQAATGPTAAIGAAAAMPNSVVTPDPPSPSPPSSPLPPAVTASEDAAAAGGLGLDTHSAMPASQRKEARVPHHPTGGLQASVGSGDQASAAATASADGSNNGRGTGERKPGDNTENDKSGGGGGDGDHDDEHCHDIGSDDNDHDIIQVLGPSAQPSSGQGVAGVAGPSSRPPSDQDGVANIDGATKATLPLPSSNRSGQRSTEQLQPNRAVAHANVTNNGDGANIVNDGDDDAGNNEAGDDNGTAANHTRGNAQRRFAPSGRLVAARRSLRPRSPRPKDDSDEASEGPQAEAEVQGTRRTRRAGSADVSGQLRRLRQKPSPADTGTDGQTQEDNGSADCDGRQHRNRASLVQSQKELQAVASHLATSQRDEQDGGQGQRAGAGDGDDTESTGGERGGGARAEEGAPSGDDGRADVTQSRSRSRSQSRGKRRRVQSVSASGSRGADPELENTALMGLLELTSDANSRSNKRDIGAQPSTAGDDNVRISPRRSRHGASRSNGNSNSSGEAAPGSKRAFSHISALRRRSAAQKGGKGSGQKVNSEERPKALALGSAGATTRVALAAASSAAPGVVDAASPPPPPSPLASPSPSSPPVPNADPSAQGGSSPLEAEVMSDDDDIHELERAPTTSVERAGDDDDDDDLYLLEAVEMAEAAGQPQPKPQPQPPCTKQPTHQLTQYGSWSFRWQPRVGFFLFSSCSSLFALRSSFFVRILRSCSSPLTLCVV
eukprot:m.309225 g.309225  ORF g.309225 m.309225 type:complete len:983 (-) comp19637_c0_seq5:62-3010(-)